MVMKRNMMRRNLSRSIMKSIGRYLAIVAIIALGASMFVGLLMTKTDMVATGQVYTDQQNMFDLRLISTYGWDLDTVDRVAELEGVADAENLIYLDLIATLNDSTDDSVYRFYAIPERINRIVLRGGRLPESPDECLADGYHCDESILGTTVTLSEMNSEESLESMTCRTFTVVGYMSTPLYMDMNRGTTSVGNGSIANYYFVPRKAFDVDYVAEIHITIPGEYALYTEEYNNAMESAAERIEPLVQPMADERLARIRQEAEEAYADGLKQYEEGLKELEEGKEKLEKELKEAYEQLTEAEKLIEQNEQTLIAGRQQIADGKRELAEGEKTLQESREQFDSVKESLMAPIEATKASLDNSYNSLKPRIDALAAELASIDGALSEINRQIAEAEAQFADLTARIDGLNGEIRTLDTRIASMNAALQVARLFPTLNAELIASLEASIAEATAQRSALEATRAALEAERAPYMESLEEPYTRRNELENRRREVAVEKGALDLAMDAVERGYEGVEASRNTVDGILASMESELKAGEEQLAEAKETLEKAERDVASGLIQLENAKEELEQGWKDYYEGKAQAENELAEAENKLADAKAELDEARETLDAMKSATVMVLDRNTNVGYNSLNSASDIVSGVSRVFPAFFLLVAALVCITTMTRMIDEERTQIGTLKALGYSNGAIIGKYLAYAGSGAVVGCGLGVFAGSMAFPSILWEAYKIMLYITDGIVLRFNWGLCAIVVGTYTTVMLFVTWYCCRKALKEEPAELIRPKAPDAGKKILLEYLPFWPKVSFLNKVTIRNIFRYRQRLAMMMVGIGGCTALLLTGFGLRDSIVNVVDYQFEEVTTYDMTVYFDGHQTPEQQSEFLSQISHAVDGAMFYHQSSMELDANHITKEIYFIAAENGVQEFIDFHSGDKALSMPGVNEVLLSVGVAENVGIDVGDQIILRNPDMEVLQLTVSGLYDNHVENYAIVIPETIEAQWGSPPETQMAFVKVPEGGDIHSTAAMITGLDGVMNVSVSEDFANMVGNMMKALDLVVIVIVVCAGALAVIVLYNLTNINITERIREIATIKVLGFNAKETAAYIFKENLSLSAIGSVLGLGLGYLLLLFVMSQIKIDIVWFKAIALPMSYVMAIALTMLSACIVDFVFYFKLDKINMAEALKSVE